MKNPNVKNNFIYYLFTFLLLPSSRLLNLQILLGLFWNQLTLLWTKLTSVKIWGGVKNNLRVRGVGWRDERRWDARAVGESWEGIEWVTNSGSKFWACLTTEGQTSDSAINRGSVTLYYLPFYVWFVDLQFYPCVLASFPGFQSSLCFCHPTKQQLIATINLVEEINITRHLFYRSL